MISRPTRRSVAPIAQPPTLSDISIDVNAARTIDCVDPSIALKAKLTACLASLLKVLGKHCFVN